MSDKTTDPKLSADLRALQARIETHLHRITDVLPQPYKLTLIARHTAMENAEIVMTVDDLPKVAETLGKHLPHLPAPDSDALKRERLLSRDLMDLIKSMFDAPTMAAGYAILADFARQFWPEDPVALRAAPDMTETAKLIAWERHGTAAGIKDVFEQYDGAEGLWAALTNTEREAYLSAARATLSGSAQQAATFIRVEQDGAVLRGIRIEPEMTAEQINAAADAALALPVPSQVADPLDIPLPCDVNLPGMRFGKGVSLRTLVDAAARWKVIAAKVPLTEMEPALEKARAAGLLTDSPSAPQLIAPTDVLTRKLALSLYETWTFVLLWAMGQAQDRGGKMHRVHAAILARLHDAMTSAYAAGLLLGDDTARLPGLLAEHGFDLEDLLRETAAPVEAKGATDA